jgi:hypothetical protein
MAANRSLYAAVCSHALVGQNHHQKNKNIKKALFLKLLSITLFSTVYCEFSFSQKEYICPSDPIPPGWVITEIKLCSCCGASSRTATQWVIEKIDDNAPGSTLLICPTNSLPDGWVIIDRRKCTCCVASDDWATQLTIKKIDGLPKGSTVLVCPTENLPLGWVVVDKKSCTCCNASGGNSTQWTIKKL